MKRGMNWYRSAQSADFGSNLAREGEVKKIAAKYKDIRNILYLGGVNMPIAYEGAFLIKEISYIHAEVILPADETWTHCFD